MQLLMTLTTALSSAGNFFDRQNTTDQRTDFTPLLVCIDEIQGSFEGVEYNQPQRVVDCGRTVTYCQKITAHYISAHSETEIEMRGCDSVQIEVRFYGVPCKNEGCHEQVIESETYNVCCCSSNMCNSAITTESTDHIAQFTVLASLYLTCLRYE